MMGQNLGAPVFCTMIFYQSERTKMLRSSWYKFKFDVMVGVPVRVTHETYSLTFYRGPAWLDSNASKAVPKAAYKHQLTFIRSPAVTDYSWPGFWLPLTVDF